MTWNMHKHQTITSAIT